jgi:hypothetical protein
LPIGEDNLVDAPAQGLVLMFEHGATRRLFTSDEKMWG